MSPSTPRSPRPAAGRGAQPSKSPSTNALRWVVLTLVVGLVVGVGTVVVLASRGSDAASTTVDASAPAPRDVDPGSFAVPVLPGLAKTKNVPKLEVWQDFQCIVCGSTETSTGVHLVDLARSGTVKLWWRPITLLDQRHSGESSLRATAAWGCAIDAGKSVEYHQAVFAAQPATEGVGFSTNRLLRLGQRSGITGADLATFRGCVRSGRYQAWAANSNAEFARAKVGGAPAAYLDGKLLANGVLADQVALDAAVHKAWKARGGDMKDMDMKDMDMSGMDMG